MPSNVLKKPRFTTTPSSHSSSISPSITIAPDPPSPAATPIKTYTIYHRVQRRKFPILLGSPPTISESPTPPPTTFYLLASPPWSLHRTKRNSKSPYLSHRHWLSTLHQTPGNPKTTQYPYCKTLALSTRGLWFSWFRVQVGGDVAARETAMMRKVKLRRWERVNWWRKLFGIKPKQWDWVEPAGAEEVVNGGVWLIEMKHTGHRKYVVDVERGWMKERLVVTGTREYLKFGKKAKGFALSLKMVRESDHTLVADLERTSKGSIKKNKQLGKQLGIIRIYQPLFPERKTRIPLSECDNPITVTPREQDGRQEELNEDATIIHILWAMLQAEHVKREKIREVLEEIAQNAGG
ncbi:hypothetical protein EX30DRAFT_348529 [Ascodesmis nigricans]|uniref:Uncharacterized protein n=1 Tax=Ascodesmis nigricans TaxID=341454 RepID=A0A4S2MYG4_9PEZI|nr:hypothetical protein EX30DRAFT_348529 [Ascodesmis nigricans]